LEASNQSLLTKLQFLREVVNNQNNGQSGYVEGRAEAIKNAKKMIQVHFALAMKYK
jgi:16S rRNA G527 N7-methylase RsmG